VRHRILLSAVLAGLVLAPPALTQDSSGSLPEAAAREKERRKASSNARIYKDADLAQFGAEPGRSPDTPAPADSPTSAPAAGQREKSDEEIRAEKKRELDGRIAAEVKVMDAVRQAMNQAQLELNDTTTLTKFGSRKEALQKILDDGQAELKKSEAVIAAIEEEARRQGISVSRP